MIFSLRAHVNGISRSISASSNGGLVLTGDFGSRPAGSLQQAIRIARDYIGEHLREANRRDVPWGLVVSVGGFSAQYGTPDPSAGVALGGGTPANPNSIEMRIWRRWRPGDSPMAALQNATRSSKRFSRSAAGAQLDGLW